MNVSQTTTASGFCDLMAQCQSSRVLIGGLQLALDAAHVGCIENTWMSAFHCGAASSCSMHLHFLVFCNA